MKHFLPTLISGISTPISTFLNLQSLTVPLATDARIFTILSLVSLLLGIIGSLAIGVRMLEIKIKAMTRYIIIIERIVIFGMAGQGILGLLDLLIFHLVKKDSEMEYTESFGYRLLASIISIFISFGIHFHTINDQPYQWTMYDLSYDQRQLIILYDVSLFYIALVSFVYQYLEDWTFEFALYWCICTFTTIGFGDLSPKTPIAMGLVIPLSFVGVLLVGSCIYSLRNVILEIFQMHLVKRFNSLVELEEEQPLLTDLEKRYQGMHQEPESESLSDHSSDQESDLTSELLITGESSHTRESSFESGANSPSRSSNLRKGKYPKDKLTPALESPKPNRISRHSSVDHIRSTTLTISRSDRLPIMQIVGNQSLQTSLIISTTKDALVRQSIIGAIVVLANIILSGIVFSWLENWTILQGFYFAYCSFMTIGINFAYKDMETLHQSHFYLEVCLFGTFSWRLRLQHF